MELRRLIIGIYILAIGFQLAYAIDNRYYVLVDSADHAIKEMQWNEAERLIVTALRLEPAAPGNVMLMSNLGIVQMHCERPEQAIATLSDALSIAPHSQVLLNNRARIYAAVGMDKEALADYGMILESNPVSEAALFGHGMLSLTMGDIAAAERDFAELERVGPETRDAHIALATLRMLRGQYEEAEIHYTALINDAPGDEYYLGRAVCRIKMGKYSEAGEDLAEGLKLNPDNADLYAQQSILCKLTYRTTEAGLYMRMARRLGYED